MYDWKYEQILLSISNGNPSLKELAQNLGLSAKSSVHERLETLREWGLVEWKKGTHRSLRLTELGERYIKANYG